MSDKSKITMPTALHVWSPDPLEHIRQLRSALFRKQRVIYLPAMHFLYYCEANPDEAETLDEELALLHSTGRVDSRLKGGLPFDSEEYQVGLEVGEDLDANLFEALRWSEMETFVEYHDLWTGHQYGDAFDEHASDAIQVLVSISDGSLERPKVLADEVTEGLGDDDMLVTGEWFNASPVELNDLQIAALTAEAYIDEALPSLADLPTELAIEWTEELEDSLLEYRLRVSDLSAEALNLGYSSSEAFFQHASTALDSELADLRARVEGSKLRGVTGRLASDVVPDLILALPALVVGNHTIRMATGGAVAVAETMRLALATLNARRALGDVRRHPLYWKYHTVR